MNIITLNQLISWFQSFQERHFFLKDFGFGEPYDIGTSRQMKFPYMWMTLNDDSVIPVASNNKTAIPEISFSILFMDKINDQPNYLDTNGFPSNNSQEILSDCLQYLQDLITEIQSYWQPYGVLFSQDVSFFPVVDETQDKATGINGRVVLRLKQVNCIIPVSPLVPSPTPPTPSPTPTPEPPTPQLMTIYSSVENDQFFGASLLDGFDNYVAINNFNGTIGLDNPPLYRFAASTLLYVSNGEAEDTGIQVDEFPCFGYMVDVVNEGGFVHLEYIDCNGDLVIRDEYNGEPFCARYLLAGTLQRGAGVYQYGLCNEPAPTPTPTPTPTSTPPPVPVVYYLYRIESCITSQTLGYLNVGINYFGEGMVATDGNICGWAYLTDFENPEFPYATEYVLENWDCSFCPQPTPTATPEPEPTPTMTPTPEPEPTPTMTPTPSQTPPPVEPFTIGNRLALDAGNSSSYSGSGSIWYDISGNDNDVELFNSPFYTSGYLTFNGLDQYGIAPDSSSLDITGTNFTCEYWVKANNIGDYIAVSKAPYNSGPGNQNGNYMLWYSDNYELFFTSIDDTGTYSNARLATFTMDTNWHQVVYVYSAGTGTYYLDANQMITTGTDGADLYPTTEPLQIARRLDGFGYLDGNLSVINISDFALTPTQITENWNYYKTRYGL